MTRRLYLTLTALLAFCFVGGASAAPRVVASVGPIHSLMSSLMEGVTKPELLLPAGVAADGRIDPFQASQLVVADLIVWVGPGLETTIAKTLEGLPALRSKSLALSTFLPLLPRRGYEGLLAERQQACDFRFWNDPRLAVMAVRHITPQLVRLDPDNQERYLENEITLLSKIRGLEKEIAAMFPADGVLSNSRGIGDQPYFVHRFVSSLRRAQEPDGGLQKVSSRASQQCTRGGVEPDELSPGPTYYFESMRIVARTLSGCISDSRTLAGQQNGQHGTQL